MKFLGYVCDVLCVFYDVLCVFYDDTLSSVLCVYGLGPPGFQAGRVGTYLTYLQVQLTNYPGNYTPLHPPPLLTPNYVQTLNRGAHCWHW